MITCRFRHTTMEPRGIFVKLPGLLNPQGVEPLGVPFPVIEWVESRTTELFYFQDFRYINGHTRSTLSGSK